MPKKLVIKINNLQDNEQEINPDRHTVTTIHWNRIVGSALALLVILALVIWLVFSPAADSPDDQSINPLATAGADSDPEVFKSETPEDVRVAAVESPQLQADEKVFAEPQIEAEPELPAGSLSDNLLKDNDSHPDTEAVASAEQFVSEVLLSVVAEDVPQVGSDEPVEQSPEKEASTLPEETVAENEEIAAENEQTIENSVTEPVEIDSISEAITQAAEPSEKVIAERVEDRIEASPEQQLAERVVTAGPNSASIVNPVRSSGPAANVLVQSDRIKIAQLTSWVENKQPRDQLGSVIYLADDELIRIFLFTDMEGLAGRTLYHSWYLGNKQMARVTIPVKDQQMRASSSKFIDQYMRGSWTVMVTDESGKLLISSNFEVKAG